MSEKRFVAANVQIWDKFDLPLQEDIDDRRFYTINEIKQEVDKRIAKLATLGARYLISQNCQIEYEIIKHEDRAACIEPIGEHKYLFRITDLVARKRNEKYLDTIIYHELCHILQIEAFVAIGLLNYFDGVLGYDKSDKAAVDTLFFKNDFHTTIWYALIDGVNSAFKVSPPIDRFLDPKTEIDIFLESTFEQDERISLPNLCIAEYRHHSKKADNNSEAEE